MKGAEVSRGRLMEEMMEGLRKNRIPDLYYNEFKAATQRNRGSFISEEA